MERKKFIDLCQQEAALPGSQSVELDGILYRPKAYILGFDKKGAPIHTCMIQDKNSNCIMYAPLDRVLERG